MYSGPMATRARMMRLHIAATIIMITGDIDSKTIIKGSGCARILILILKNSIRPNLKHTSRSKAWPSFNPQTRTCRRIPYGVHMLGHIWRPSSPFSQPPITTIRLTTRGRAAEARCPPGGCPRPGFVHIIRRSLAPSWEDKEI